MVAYTMSGTATPAVAYTFNSAATFEIGSSTFSIVVTPVKDSENEADETVTLTISTSDDRYSCAQEGFEERSVVNSEDISSRVDRADGSDTIYWNEGSTWVSVAPLD